MLENLFSPLLMTVLTSSTLIAITALCFSHTKIMIQIGYRLLIFVVALITLRFLFPIELPFSYNIVLPEALSYIIVHIRKSYFTWKNIKISPWSVFIFVWFTIAVVLIIRYLASYHHTKNQLKLQGKFLTKKEPYFSIVNKICQEQNRKNPFQVIECADIQTPCLFGIFQPYIILPENFHFSNRNLYIILRHEAAHHFHHDLLIKASMKLITLIYWWNPICWILNRQTDVLLDMRIDERLSSESNLAKKEYLNCLLQVADASVENMHPKSDITVSICQNHNLMEQRFSMITKPKKKQNFLTMAAFSTAVITFAFSYIFIFEASYTPPEVAQYDITSDKGYLIHNTDGSYDLYIYEYYIDTIENPWQYPDLQIYEEGEIINEN